MHISFQEASNNSVIKVQLQQNPDNYWNPQQQSSQSQNQKPTLTNNQTEEETIDIANLKITTTLPLQETDTENMAINNLSRLNNDDH